MKTPIQVLLSVLCAALILAMPFVISSPTMLSEKAEEILERTEGEEEEEAEEEDAAWLRFLFPGALAESSENDLLIEDVEEGKFSVNSAWELPVDLSAGPKPNPEAYTENGYEDESIQVTVETLEEDGVIWHIARIRIASPTQLRTGIAGDKLTSKKTRYVSTMAEMYNAVIALNGDDYQNDTAKTSFEYRMGEMIRNKSNKMKDILIIDEKGDFHLFIKSEGMNTDKNRKVKDIDGFNGTIVNAFTFGPALVRDGELLTVDTGYGYNPNGKEPRTAIGQTGELSYLFLIAEGRGESSGVTQQQLAEKMFALGCVQAYNLDGGNSAEMVFHGEMYKGMPGGSERPLNDIIYFATAVPEGQ